MLTKTCRLTGKLALKKCQPDKEVIVKFLARFQDKRTVRFYYIGCAAADINRRPVKMINAFFSAIFTVPLALSAQSDEPNQNNQKAIIFFGS